MTFVSYAQNLEDVMLWRALQDVETGFYVDVGACEPYADSVTQAFYERGWNGINIEPAPRGAALIAQARPRDITLQLAIGEAAGEATFYAIDLQNGLSTLRHDFAARYERDGSQVTPMAVVVDTLDAVLERHQPAVIHFLKVDVEGFEREVLAGLDLGRWRPWVVLLETAPPGSDDPPYTAWEPLLVDGGYQFAYYDGLNRFYVHNDHGPTLLARFATPPNVFDNYVRVSEVRLLNELNECRARMDENLSTQPHLQSESTRVQDASADSDPRVASLSATLAELRERLVEAETATRGERERADRLAEGAQALNSRCEAAVQRADAHAREIDRIAMERDACRQELFEANRYGAQLVAVRQKLLEDVHAQGRSLTSQMRDLDIRHEMLEEMRAEQARLHAANADLNAQLSHHRAWIDAVYSSTSWAVSRPIRAIKRILVRR